VSNYREFRMHASDVRTGRGDDLFVSMVTNSLAHARDHDALGSMLQVAGEVAHV
jgi:hypothetical protein